jgi:hypothetical protein
MAAPSGTIEGAKKSIAAMSAVLTIFWMCLRIAVPWFPRDSRTFAGVMPLKVPRRAYGDNAAKRVTHSEEQLFRRLLLTHSRTRLPAAVARRTMPNCFVVRDANGQAR